MVLTPQQIQQILMQSFQQDLKDLMDQYGVVQVESGPHGAGFQIGTVFLKIDDVHYSGDPIMLPVVLL